MNEAAPRLAFGIGPDGSYTLGGQILAFVLGLLTMFLFLPLLVLGAMLYGRAEETFPTNADRARVLVNLSWISIAAPVVLAIVGGAAVAVAVLAMG